MKVLGSATDLSHALDSSRALGRSIGLVPTMGALHSGHRSLIDRAASECDVVVVTIFVNPTQFGDPHDIETYPRDLAADLAICAESGVDVVFAPPVAAMYPDWPSISTSVSVGIEASQWEGRSRPGHFQGVATVVAKLFAMAGRCRAYFGEKDFQQLVVVRRMTRDLAFPVEVIGCPTLREESGLAMSSRNRLLTEQERGAASVLARALAAGHAAASAGAPEPRDVVSVMTDVVAEEPLVELD